ncbi:hypothetical protein [Pseudoalteromonas luteoviolacea]|uniref:Uncharacterized protein n=1 Tax=Pseudoalteromonas luteoviolacea NCIMB 1942 TaxID=1365253 RepID=A0A167HC05_9GAMM|nr:hypothetical protein [Pseudoalteromonas luteoviolacea]KZN57956.1 hypothetical protein N482_22915 [Pseudoalteromonas luteoviolacea NCIMB 1942]
MTSKIAFFGLALTTLTLGLDASAGQDITFKLAATTDGSTHPVSMPIMGRNAFSFDLLLDYQYQSNAADALFCTIKIHVP